MGLFLFVSISLNYFCVFIQFFEFLKFVIIFTKICENKKSNNKHTKTKKQL